ncbi:DNA-binding CsgD family transcriptional regulator [Kitasatospora sp. GAS204A]|uniref:helix-turn-helix transcriptional regulator n=1 Tax=unclassified Kitasatospora TaxID=2633591 RepID=UPI002476FA94|nr:LuxR family transcriptional regulator [Kitasatospora sp. GAS204B]MDH6120149.1 DNA-binding CsgD family transcriptional regulator [Kitasatospora sp. GAS204B]
MTARSPLVDRVCGELRQVGAVAVVGPTGFGKSAVLDAVCTAWQAAGDPVVRLSSAPADAHIAYAPLVDLFTACPAEVSGELSELQRSAIDWVMRRVVGPEPDATTLRVTVLSCLQAWGRRARPLLAADEVHWWGPGSLDVFRFAARRSRGSVSLLAALRPDGPAAHDVLGGGAVEIGIPTLSPQESAALVRALGLPLRTAGRIHAATGGNPRLVSDIAAGLARTGTPAPTLHVQPLAPFARKATHAWLADLAEGVRPVLLLAALAADPSLDAVRRAAGPPADAALAAAEAAGLVRVTDATVLFPAPVVRESLVAEAGDEAVRRAHHLLATASAEPDDRAWHEASALAPAELPARLVATLADAAGAARERGDRARAAEFGLLAGDRVGGARPDLLVAAARDAEAAGRLDLAWTAMERLARTGADATARARARIAVVDAAGRGAALLKDIAAQALADATAGDEPALISAAHLRLAWSTHLNRGFNAEAVTHARDAVAWAERAGDPESRAAALSLIARLEQGRGSPDRTAALPLTLGPGAAGRDADRLDRRADPRRAAVRFALLDDQLADAGRLLDELRPVVGRVGGRADLLWLLGRSVHLHAQRGAGRLAREEAGRMLALARELGASPGPPWYAAASAELVGGSLEQALAYAGLGLTAAQEETDLVLAAHCLHLSGLTRLLLRDTAGALADLLRVRDLVRDLAVGDPAVIRYDADLAEALVAAGDLAAATRTVAAARRRAEELGRRGVLASLDRAEALCRTAAGEFGPAEELLVRALDAFEQLGYPLERGRVLLTRSAVERRRRHPARARALQAAAEAVFREAGAPLWGPGRAEHSGAPSWLAGLTDAEKRIAELVADGYGNRDIAAAQYVSVKTVEAVLTRIYRKLEVRSRVQLVALARKDERHSDR